MCSLNRHIVKTVRALYYKPFLDVNPVWPVDPSVVSAPINSEISLSLELQRRPVQRELNPNNDAAFGDERADNSDDDRPLPELSEAEKILLHRALAEHAPNVPNCRDLS